MRTILFAFAAIFLSNESVAHDLMGTWVSESGSTTIALEFEGPDACEITIHNKDVWHSMGWRCSEMVVGENSISIVVEGNSYQFEYDYSCECLAETTGSFLQDEEFRRVER